VSAGPRNYVNDLIAVVANNQQAKSAINFRMREGVFASCEELRAFFDFLIGGTHPSRPYIVTFQDISGYRANFSYCDCKLFLCRGCWRGFKKLVMGGAT